MPGRRRSSTFSWVSRSLIFFGGVFYSLGMVDEAPVIGVVTRLNPATYLVDGIRYGMLGIHETNVAVGAGFLVVFKVVLGWITVRLFERGWKLKV